MSEKRPIGRLYDIQKDNQEFDPYTSFDAVLDSDGNTLTERFKNNIIGITYKELKNKVDNSLLTPGQLYRITNYVCSTSKAYTKSANHKFDLIVVADDKSHLNCKARAIQHSGDTYFSDCDLSKWEIWYDINNDIDKYDWAYPDSNGLIHTDDDLTFDYKGTIKINNSTYYLWYNKNFDPDESTQGYLVTTIHSDDMDPDDIYYASTINYESLDNVSIVSEDYSYIEYFSKSGTNIGKGVIYKMIDDKNNECSYDFKNILFGINYDDYENNQLFSQGTDYYLYTFSSDVLNGVKDSSIYNKYVINNKISYGHDPEEFKRNALCHNLFISENVFNNILIDSQYNILRGASYNSLISNCNNNYLNWSSHNYLHKSSHSNRILSSDYNNLFFSTSNCIQNNSKYNYLYLSGSNNISSSNCNTFNYSSYCTIGSGSDNKILNSNNILFGIYCYNNTIENCRYITFSVSGSNHSAGGYYKYFTIRNNKYLYIYSAFSRSYSYGCGYVQIPDSLKYSTNNNWDFVSIPYSQLINMDSSYSQISLTVVGNNNQTLVV